MNTIPPAAGAAFDLAAHGAAYAPEISSAARRHGLDPRLLAAVAAQETGGPGSNAGRNVVGDGGHGHGVFQIDDRYHAFASSAGAMDPAKNADYAAGMLAGLIQRNGGDVRRALSAYNAGSPTATGTVTTWGDGSRLGYADSVLRHYAQLGGTPQPVPPQRNGSVLDDAFAIVEELLAERLSEQQNVGALASLASQQSPSYSYRQLAGLDSNGNAADEPDFGAIVDGDD